MTDTIVASDLDEIATLLYNALSNEYKRVSTSTWSNDKLTDTDYWGRAWNVASDSRTWMAIKKSYDNDNISAIRNYNCPLAMSVTRGGSGIFHSHWLTYKIFDIQIIESLANYGYVPQSLRMRPRSFEGCYTSCEEGHNPNTKRIIQEALAVLK